MKNKLFLFLSLIVMLSVFIGLTVENPWGSKDTSIQRNVINGTRVVYGPALEGPLSTISESFEGATFPPAGWIKLSPDGGTGWASITAGTTPLPGWNGGVATVPAGGGTKTAYASWNTGGAASNNQWLITPQITNVQSLDSLKFWLRKVGYTNNYLDSFQVRISTTTPTLAAFTTIVMKKAFPSLTPDTNWAEYKYNIGSLVPAGSNIYIALIEMIGDNLNDGAAFQLDLVSVTNSTLPVARTWTEQVSGLATTLYSVSAVSNDVAWASGAAGKVVRTTNKGLTWTNVSGDMPITLALYCIFAWDANNAIVTGVAGTNTSIYKTSNGGTNWIAANTHAGFGDDLYMTSATDGYFIGDPSGGNWDLLKSTNGGTNWASWSTVPTTNTAGTYNNAAWFQGTQVWFPSVGQSQMLYTSNMGTNWAVQTIPLAEITATCFNSATTGLAGGSSTSVGLIKTTDAGTTWATVPATFFGALTISAIAGSGTEYWASLQSTTIYYSSNDGANWALQYTAAAGSFYHMTKSRTGNTLWAVRSNGAISRYGDPITGVTPIATTVPENFSLGQNYPNPFNPTTNIKFAVPQTGLVTIKVYDMLGKEIATLVNGVKNAGSYVVDFNASTLASGVYFYKMEVNGFREVKRMTLIK